ncbi:MAG: pyridoxal-phosphate dependent enzyme, partial [Gammaproteobacteria bacterium]|nr:pyridoxal-phosphate dependent enzyme [Gammaproteobacteria bacterium]
AGRNNHCVVGPNTIGIIRGEKHTPLNSTLSFAEKCGMQLHYCNRMDYRKKNEPEYLEKLKQQFGDVYILPEGGSNILAMKGCAEIINEISQDKAGTIDSGFDVICCASGTGATLAGLISAIKPAAAKNHPLAIGFSALKGGDFLKDEVSKFLGHTKTTVDWRIESNYHFGGYAKVNDDLIYFMKDFQTEYGFALDAVYTGKMFYGLFCMIEHNHFRPGTRIIAIHSGGLQGNVGFGL